MGKELFIEQLKRHQKEKTFTQMMFVFPGNPPFFFKGYVLNVTEEDISFDDIKEGVITFSLEYLQKIKEIKEIKEINGVDASWNKSKKSWD